MKHFWTHVDRIPDGYGYGMFTPGHFGWIAITVLLVASITIGYNGADHDTRLAILRAIAATLMIIDVLKMIVIGISDVRVVDYLPLEMCSFAAYFTVLDSIWPESTFFREMLVTLFMPGALMAVIFPTTMKLPFINFFTIHQFLFHGLIVAYVIARFAAGEIPLTYAGVWASVLKAAVLVAVMYVVDRKFDKNFMFLTDPYGNALLNVIWKKTGGGFAYVIGLICFSITVMHVFFAVFKILEVLFLH